MKRKPDPGAGCCGGMPISRITTVSPQCRYHTDWDWNSTTSFKTQDPREAPRRTYMHPNTQVSRRTRGPHRDTSYPGGRGARSLAACDAPPAAEASMHPPNAMTPVSARFRPSIATWQQSVSSHTHATRGSTHAIAIHSTSHTHVTRGSAPTPSGAQSHYEAATGPSCRLRLGPQAEDGAPG